VVEVDHLLGVEVVEQVVLELQLEHQAVEQRQNRN
jgi:hypothetical protein